MTRPRAALLAGLLAAMAGCVPEAPGPTAEDADAYVASAEARLLALQQEAIRAGWLHHTLGGTETAAT
ncbi:MAG: hypothetical protein OXG72_04185, partial [Acidobacteria bacterium]|nr:hypothetical protein [Acidobacteriota bacterium]